MNRNKTLSLSLFISLGANLFLAGVLSAQLFAPAPPPPVPAQARGPLAKGLGPLTDTAKTTRQKEKRQLARRQRAEGSPPRADMGPPGFQLTRALIRVIGDKEDPRVQELRSSTKEGRRELRKKMRQSSERVTQAITAEEFDEVELRSALSSLHQLAGQTQSSAQESLITLAASLTPEERASLKTELSKPLAPGRMNKRRKGPPEHR